MDVSAHKDLQAQLVEVFVSQVQGGKNYTDAILGRRAANATFFASHSTDKASGLTFGMDLTPLLQDKSLSPEAYVLSLIADFENSVKDNLKAMQ